MDCHKPDYRFLIRIALLVAASVAMGLAVSKKTAPVYIIGLFFLMLLFIWQIISYISKTNKHIQYFLKAVRNEDSSRLFARSGGSRMINQLHNSLNELNQLLQQRSIRQQQHEKYLHDILDQLDTAIMVFDNQGIVSHVNHAALRLFGLPALSSLRQLDKIDPIIRQILMQQEMPRERLLNMKFGTNVWHLRMRTAKIHTGDQCNTIISLQDIKTELDNKELDSWSKLIRVLNHEIMNSLAPITSIAQSLETTWQVVSADKPDQNLINQTLSGLNVIAERGEALTGFLNSYRSFARRPEPVIKPVSICAFIDRLNILASAMKEEYHIPVFFNYPDEDFPVNMDEQLMVQVMLNLVKNSMEALAHQAEPRLEIFAKPLSGCSVELCVKDNGPGIAGEIKDDVFTPFFTTKQGGTGVGLSYSRQILRAHRGEIDFISEPGNTCFYVRL